VTMASGMCCHATSCPKTISASRRARPGALRPVGPAGLHRGDGG
jgi:hypothetical protein